MKDESRTASRCPVCGGNVDRLRAPAVSIADGAILYFCSAGCRQQYRSGETSSIAEDTSAPDASSEPAPEDDTNPESSSSLAEPLILESDRRPLRKARRLGAAGLSGIGLALVLHFALRDPSSPVSKIVSLIPALTLVGITAYLFVRRRGSRTWAATLESLAWPIAVLVYAIVSLDRHAASGSWRSVFACFIAAAPWIGQWVEIELLMLARLYPLSAAYVQGSLLTHEERSPFGRLLKRLADALAVGVFPTAILVSGIFAFWRGSASLDILAASLVVISPGLLRRSALPVWEAALLRMKEVGCLVSDIAALSPLASSGRVAFIPDGVLTTTPKPPTLEPVEPGVDLPLLSSRLKRLGESVATPWSSHLKALKGDGASLASDAVARILRSSDGEGLTVEDAFGELVLGTPLFLLESGISPTPAEKLIHSWEEQGLEVLLIADRGRVTAVLILEVRLNPRALEVNERLALHGRESVYLAPEQHPVAVARARTLGMEHIRPAVSERETENALKELGDSGSAVILVAEPSRAARFRPFAGTAIGLGEPTDLGGLPVSIPSADLNVVPSVLSIARSAQRIALANMGMTFLLCGLGGFAALTGDLSPVAAALLVTGAGIVSRLSVYLFSIAHRGYTGRMARLLRIPRTR